MMTLFEARGKRVVITVFQLKHARRVRWWSLNKSSLLVERLKPSRLAICHISP
jgi:hypothetical protein